MPVHSVTRLKLRGVWLVPGFMRHAAPSLSEAKAAPGCLAADVRATGPTTFWTRTTWQDESSMRAYVGGGKHKAAMGTLAATCREAGYHHWSDDSSSPPDWDDAVRRLATDGTLSKVDRPSRHHERGLPAGSDTPPDLRPA